MTFAPSLRNRLEIKRVNNGMPKDRDLADTKAICNMLIQGGGQIKASN